MKIYNDDELNNNLLHYSRRVSFIHAYGFFSTAVDYDDDDCSKTLKVVLFLNKKSSRHVSSKK